MDQEPRPPTLEAIRCRDDWVELFEGSGEPDLTERIGFRVAHLFVLPLVASLLCAVVFKLVGVQSLTGLVSAAALPFVLIVAFFSYMLWQDRGRPPPEPHPEALVRLHEDRLELPDQEPIPIGVIRSFAFEGEELVIALHSAVLEDGRVALNGWPLKHRALLLRYLRGWREGRAREEAASLVLDEGAIWVDDQGLSPGCMTRPLFGCSLAPFLGLTLLVLGAGTVSDGLLLFLGILAGVWMVVGLSFTALFAWLDTQDLTRQKLQLQVEDGIVRAHRLVDEWSTAEQLLEASLAELTVELHDDTLRLAHPHGSCEVRPSDPSGAAAWLRSLRAAAEA